VIPTAHGYVDEESQAEGGGKVRKYFVGEEGANGWRSGMEVGSMMSDGIGELVFICLVELGRWMGGRKGEDGREGGVELAKGIRRRRARVREELQRPGRLHTSRFL